MNTPLNEPLFRQIQNQLRTHPEQYNQSEWGDGSACGAVCCLAGWAALLEHPGAKLYDDGVIGEDGKDLGTIWNVAAEALNLGERSQDSLFFKSDWENQELANRLDAAQFSNDHKAQAEIACEYLDWYLETQK